VYSVLSPFLMGYGVWKELDLVSAFAKDDMGRVRVCMDWDIALFG